MENDSPNNNQLSTTQSPSLETTGPLKKKYSYLWIVTILILIIVAVSGIYLGLRYNKTQRSQTAQIAETQVPPTLIPSPSSTTAQVSQIYTAKLPEEIINSKIFYSDPKTGVMYLLDGLKSAPIKIGRGDLHSAAFSADHSKLFYGRDVVEPGTNGNLGLVVYDIATRISKDLTQDKSLHPRSVHLSPDNKLIYLDYGTGVEGSGKIISYPQLSVIVPSLSVSSSYGTSYGWTNNTEFVFTELDSRFGRLESGGHGISKVTLPSGRKQTLLAATALDEYGIREIMDGKIYYTKISVESEDDWNSGTKDNWKETYWVMNADGSQKQQVAETPFDKFTKKIEAALPTQYADYVIPLDPQKHPLNPNWVLFSGYSRGRSDGTEWVNAIMDLSNPQSTFTIIGKGSTAKW